MSRPRLLEPLIAGRDRKLTLVSAPAGFGKTTMLTEWVATAAATTSFAWVSLDAGDAEPTRFWTHIIAALSGSQPTVGHRSMAALRAQPGRVVEIVIPALVEELAACDGSVVLILDDFHLAETLVIDEQLQLFIGYRPAEIQVVVTTRSDPALGIAKLRASDELVEVRADALRFSAAEVSAFFDGVDMNNLMPSSLERLTERTGGWPAPIRLAALLAPAEDRDSFIDSFDGGSRQVVDYLAGDVLDLLTADSRDFLLQVSVLDRLSGPLCDAVTGRVDSGERLAALELGNFFISTDIETQWYHLHHLFAGALRFELSRTQPELVTILHARAAAWLTDVGDFEAATEHAIAARDVRLSARLISRQLQVMTAAGRSATVRRWLDALSWPAAVEEAELGFVRAVDAALDNDYDGAVEHLRLAQTGHKGDQDANGLTLGFRADFLMGIVAVTHVAEAETAARRAVTSAPSDAWEGIALGALGQSLYLQGRFDEAVAVLRHAVRQIPDGNPVLLAVAVGSLGLAEMANGEPSSRAAPMLETLLDVLTAIGAERTTVAAVLHLALGEQDRRAGELRSALRRFETAIELIDVAPRGTWLVLAEVLASTVQSSLGEPEAALARLDAADAILDRIPDPGILRTRTDQLRGLLNAPAKVSSEFGDSLSGREVGVLRLLAEGLNQRQIGQQLFISHNTVKSHLKSSYRKLGVSSRAEAVQRLRTADSTHARAGRSKRSHPGEERVAGFGNEDTGT